MNLITMPNTITLSAPNKCQEYLYGNIIEKGDYLRLYVCILRELSVMPYNFTELFSIPIIIILWFIHLKICSHNSALSGFFRVYMIFVR